MLKMVKGATLGDDIGKIFVGGLSHETTQDSLKVYFSRFGAVTDCIVMKEPVSKKSRGFGFVTFNDPMSVDAVVAQKEPHILDGKTIDPKRAVPRGPGQSGQLMQQQNRDNNITKVFVGGIANGTTEDDLHSYFSAYGKVLHVHLMYDNQPGMPRRMRGFGFVTFDSSQAVEKTTNIHFHQINGKTVEVKRAEQRDSKSKNMMMVGSPGMPSPYQQPPGGPPGYGGQYAQPASYGMQHPVGMGRGYPGYGAVPPNPGAPYSGGAPGAVPGYGYGVGAPTVTGPPYGADTAATMYGRGTTPGRDGASAYPAPGYGAPTYSTGVASPAPPAPVSVASGSYPDYGRVAPSQPGQLGGAPTPHVDNAGPPDYAAYGLGNYQQQDLQYGPTRTSFSSDAGYGSYGSADPSAYGGGGGGGGPTGYGDSFGRGASASRGFHPYGR